MHIIFDMILTYAHLYEQYNCNNVHSRINIMVFKVSTHSHLG